MLTMKNTSEWRKKNVQKNIENNPLVNICYGVDAFDKILVPESLLVIRTRERERGPIAEETPPATAFATAGPAASVSAVCRCIWIWRVHFTMPKTPTPRYANINALKNRPTSACKWTSNPSFPSCPLHRRRIYYKRFPVDLCASFNNESQMPLYRLAKKLGSWPVPSCVCIQRIRKYSSWQKR